MSTIFPIFVRRVVASHALRMAVLMLLLLCVVLISEIIV
jgi:hypothetical protein